MKAINLKTLLTILITTLLLSGCMPDSLTKWNADPPQLIEEPVPVTPIPPTAINYASPFIISSDEDIEIVPDVDGTQLTFSIWECSDATDLVCDSSLADIPTDFPGYTFDTATGIIKGKLASPTTHIATKYYKVKVTNSEVTVGNEPVAYLNMTTYEPLSRSTTSMYYTAGTHLVITVTNADAFEYTGATSNEKRHIINQTETGKALINYIDTTGTTPILYAEFSEAGVFSVGDTIDVGTSGYSTEKAEIKDITIALPSGQKSHPVNADGSIKPFLTFNVSKGDAQWNASPLLPENHLLEDRDYSSDNLLIQNSTLPIQNIDTDPHLWTLTVKGVDDCVEPSTDPDRDSKIAKCKETVRSALSDTEYQLTLSNPLMSNPEDYITYSIKLNFSEAPKYFGYGQFAILRVTDASQFDIGDVVSTSSTEGDLKGIVVNIDIDNTRNYDKLYIEVQHGEPRANAQLGQRYPLEGPGVTRLLSEDEEATETAAANYPITAYTPYSAIMQIGGGEITYFKTASYPDTTSAPNPRPFFLVDAGYDTADTTNTLHPHWYGQGYMVDASDTVSTSNTTNIGSENIYIMGTEMSGFMDNNSVNLNDLSSRLDADYYTNNFRDIDNNKLLVQTASPLLLYSESDIAAGPTANATKQLTTFKQANLQLKYDSTGTYTLAKCISSGATSRVGGDFTFETTIGASTYHQASRVIGCSGDDYRIKLDAYSLTTSIASPTRFHNPYETGADETVEKIELDRVFYIHNNEAASLLLFKGKGSNVSFSISPELPTGLFLDKSTGNLRTVDAEGKPTVISAPPGRYNYTLTAFNALGKIEYHFSIEIISAMKLFNAKDNVKSYILHQAGQGHQRRNCELTQGQLEKGGANNTILCYLDAGENELHTNGLDFKFKVDKNLCESVVYKPYYYFRDRFADVEVSSYHAVFSDYTDSDDGSGNHACPQANSNAGDSDDQDNPVDTTKELGLPADWYVGTKGSDFELTADAETVCSYYLPGKNSRCGVGSVSVSIDLYKYDGTNCAASNISKTFDCTATYGFRNCLGGAGADVIARLNDSINNPLYSSRLVQGDEYTAISGINLSIKHFADATLLGDSNRFYSNYTITNACNNSDNYNYYVDHWIEYAQTKPVIDYAVDTDGDTTTADYDKDQYLFGDSKTYSIQQDGGAVTVPLFSGDQFLALADPFKLAHPFYTFECLDSAHEVKGIIRVVVRDWDNDFKAKDDIDQMTPASGKMTIADSSEDNFQEWDAIPTDNNGFIIDTRYFSNGADDATAADNSGTISQTCLNGPPIPIADIDGNSHYYLYNMEILGAPLEDDRASTAAPSTSMEQGIFYGFPRSNNEPDYQQFKTDSTLIDTN